jgi:hypothetical protein
MTPATASCRPVWGRAAALVAALSLVALDAEARPPKKDGPAVGSEDERMPADPKAAGARPGADARGPDAPAAEAPAGSEPGPAKELVGEALRLGPFQAPPRPYPFPLLGDDKARELYVDRGCRLYKDRPYSGHVPECGGPKVERRGRCRVQDQTLTWVGFQNAFGSSRVFVQVEKEACGYVYRPDDLHIAIDLPAVTVSNPNLRRDILTGAFPTAVDQIRVEEVIGRGTRIIIQLREPRRYLSAHLGRYVFVDVAR